MNRIYGLVFCLCAVLFPLNCNSSFAAEQDQTATSAHSQNKSLLSELWDFIVFVGSWVYKILRPYDYMDFSASDAYIRNIVLFMKGASKIKERGSYFRGNVPTDVIKNSEIW